jgi:hypothetical protein
MSTKQKDPMTTIQVLRSDADELFERFGGPQWRALRIALGKVPCAHPEADRSYVQATLPVGTEAITLGGETRTINGFYCAACRTYVLPEPEPA